MVFRFKLVSDEVTNFSREIEIDSESTFLDLRNTILESVDYSKDEYDCFFLCDDDWERDEAIVMEDFGSSSDQDVWVMDDTPIGEMIEEEGQKLVFVFDDSEDRQFYMELKEMMPGKKLSMPLCTVKKGKAPSQFVKPAEEPEKKVDVASLKLPETDLDEEFFGDSEYNDDELPEGDMEEFDMD